MKDMFKSVVKKRKYKNILDAQRDVQIYMKLSGSGVFEVICDPVNGIKRVISPLGLVCFLCWTTAYYYCAYKVISEDETILRKLYNTQLRQYGDWAESAVSTAFVTYAMWKIPFLIGITSDFLQNFLEIDNSIENMGVIIDYRKSARRALFSTLVQVIVGLTRLFSVMITMSYLEISVPLEVIFQASYSDVFALVVAAHYCNYLDILKSRYEMINKLLIEVKDRKSWEHIVLVRGKQPVHMERFATLREKYICEKIKACAIGHSALFKTVEATKSVFGFALACDLSFCLFYIILYLFYFMEATATGMFHDMQKYIYFLIYVFWQIAYTIGVIFLNVYFSEMVVGEANKTSFVVHQIINADISPRITEEATRLSLQLLHQIPVFTACDLTKIDYMLILQGARTITTFLIILIQFVTD